MKKAMMIAAMVGVIGLAGANSAMANWFYTYSGTDLDFFNAGNWFFFAPGGPQGGVVPGTGVDNHVIKPGGYADYAGSILYDPFNQSPGNMVYTIGDNGEPWGQTHSIGGAFPYYQLTGPVYTPWTFRQESGDLTFGAANAFALAYMGTYEMNAGKATFGLNLEIWKVDGVADGGAPMGPSNNLFDQNAGEVVVADTLYVAGISGGGSGTAVYSLGGGTCQAETLIVNPGGVLNFEPGSTGVLYLNTGNHGAWGVENDLIALGKIVDLGGEGFVITELVAGDYAGYTEIKLVAASGGVVPEPAGLGLMGLALLAVRKRRS